MVCASEPVHMLVHSCVNTLVHVTVEGRFKGDVGAMVSQVMALWA
jgi:hypothetical protein